jgi:hypothetical protein
MKLHVKETPHCLAFPRFAAILFVSKIRPTHIMDWNRNACRLLIRPNKIIGVFPVTRPSLYIPRNPSIFIALYILFYLALGTEEGINTCDQQHAYVMANNRNTNTPEVCGWVYKTNHFGNGLRIIVNMYF